MGAYESARAIAGYNLVSFSEQQVIDCSSENYDTYGCDGGWYYDAWEYMKANEMDKETDYPYTGVQGNCN